MESRYSLVQWSVMPCEKIFRLRWKVVTSSVWIVQDSPKVFSSHSHRKLKKYFWRNDGIKSNNIFTGVNFSTKYIRKFEPSAFRILWDVCNKGKIKFGKKVWKIKFLLIINKKFTRNLKNFNFFCYWGPNDIPIPPIFIHSFLKAST